MKAIKSIERLYFETVLIPDGDFEVINSKSPSSSSMKITSSDITSSLPDGLKIEDCSEETAIPLNSFLTNKIKEESGVKDELEANNEKPAMFKRVQPDYILMDEITQDSSDISSVTSSFGNEIPKLTNSGTSLKKNHDLISRKKMKVLKLQKKEKYLTETLNRIDGVMKGLKNVSNSPPNDSLKINKDTIGTVIKSPHYRQSEIPKPTNSGTSLKKTQDLISREKMKVMKLQKKEKYLTETLIKIDGVMKGLKNVSNSPPNDSLKIKKDKIGTVIKSPHSRQSEGTQKENNSSQLFESSKRIQDSNKPSDINSINKELNIDFLKDCIIKASRTLIKTEKSLKVLGKLLHREVLIEKRSAVKHVENFQYIVNTFRKTMNGIDQNLLIHYKHIIPDIHIGPKGDSTKNNLDPQEYRESIINLNNLMNSGKQLELIIPAVASKQVEEVLNDLSGNQNDISNVAVHVPNIVRLQSERKKRRKGNNGCQSSKRIKTHCTS